MTVLVQCPCCGEVLAMRLLALDSDPCAVPLTGADVRARREALGLSQRALGALCGYSGPYLCQLEDGSRPMTGKVKAAVTQALAEYAEVREKPTAGKEGKA